MDYQAGARSLQLSPKVVDMNRDRVRIRLLIDAVKLLFQDGFGHDAPEPPHHLLQDCQLLARQPYRRPGDRELAPDRVEAEIASLERYSKNAAGPTQQSLDPGDQLAHREGLGQIVVGPGVEAGNPVLDRIARRQDQDRQSLSDTP